MRTTATTTAKQAACAGAATGHAYPYGRRRHHVCQWGTIGSDGGMHIPMSGAPSAASPAPPGSPRSTGHMHKCRGGGGAYGNDIAMRAARIRKYAHHRIRERISTCAPAFGSCTCPLPRMHIAVRVAVRTHLQLGGARDEKQAAGRAAQRRRGGADEHREVQLRVLDPRPCAPPQFGICIPVRRPPPPSHTHTHTRARCAPVVAVVVYIHTCVCVCV